MRAKGTAARWGDEGNGELTASERWTRAVAIACVRVVYTSLGARDVGCCAAEVAAARCDGHDNDDGSRNNSSDGRSWFRGRMLAANDARA